MKVGFISFAHHHAYGYAESLAQLPDVTLAGIYDVNEERGSAVAQQYNTKYYNDLDVFLETDVEAVIICSENAFHKEHVIKAAEQRKHILCEKPIATNLEDAHEMIEICEKNQVTFEIAFPVRFSKAIIEAKKILDSGSLGKLLAIRTTNRGKNPMEWFVDKALSGGGSVIDHTVHMVDIIRWFTGQEVQSVYAEIDTFFKDTPVEDAGILSLTLNDGTIITHDCSWSRCDHFPTWGDVSIELFGSKASLKADLMKEHIQCYQDDGEAVSQVFLGNNMDYGLMQNFVEIVKGNRKAFISGMDGLKALEVGLAAYRSNEKHETVRI